ncbi:NUDIX hydrolase [Oceaniglobus trochenteri]|uniref:NUDIX hydrolase n=1 Tax=Oceaniglobus trochenteri TaxID=2763260 RepID=UPI001CFFD02D|nr:NUDIX domain-containing protein [Oceaniglobus trochenteri]
MALDKSALRDAATLILVRDAGGPTPQVLMGQRGRNAAFMPGKFVFPGGAVDPTDTGIPMARAINGLCRARLTQAAGRAEPLALVAAAIRELWEETGLILGQPHRWPGTPPENWRSFAETGHLPAPTGMRFVFRAITPPGRPRRFDARFFLADAARIAGDPDDFSRASDELSHLQWIPLAKARSFDLPFITEVVLAEVAARLPALDAPPSVPFFQNNDEESLFRRLGRAGAPL